MSAMDDSAENSNSIPRRNSTLPVQPVLLSETPAGITHPFECCRCSKRFASTQALGGHQNAHKKERNEERRLYIEQRLALKRQTPPTMTIPSPTPLLIVQPDGSGGVQSFGHFEPPALPILPSYGPMVQLQPVAPDFIYSYGGLKAPVFVPAEFEYGLTRTGFKGGEFPYEASHKENQNYHPCKNPVNTKPMPLKLYPNEERDFWAKAEEESKESYADQALINEGREDADKTTSKEKEMNLTLRL